MYRQSAWSIAAVEDHLSDSIGLKCQIARYYNPKPTKWVFEDVHLQRAGEDAVVVPVLQAELINDTWQLSADSAQVAWTSRHRLWEAVQEGLLLKRTGKQALKLNVTEVQFQEIELPPLRHVQVKHDPTSPTAMASWAKVGLQDNAPTIQLAIDTSAGLPSKLTLHTDHLRTDLLALALPPLSDLGVDAYYDGRISFDLMGETPLVELQGDVLQIDLSTALASKFHLQGAGNAILHLSPVVIRTDINNIVRAKGAIVSHNSHVSRRLLNQAAQHLGVSPLPHSPIEDMFAYHQAAIGFDHDQGGLVLTGLCGNMPEGTMFASRERPLVFDNGKRMLASTSLTNAFYNNASPSVPSSQGAVDMARWLAVPSVNGAHQGATVIATRPTGSPRY
ncbi:hypothetical protein C5Y93_02085 [Blastopirellula marina]|uniref:DUF3971 domain-containing protein n=2 Tax=Blastopirellula marina TaxID=124 RepID=A0A2S8GTU8_9BACT|nr:hypothetical protein C5Y93_02085 [Blastopirellula marina]